MLQDNTSQYQLQQNCYCLLRYSILLTAPILESVIPFIRGVFTKQGESGLLLASSRYLNEKGEGKDASGDSTDITFNLLTFFKFNSNFVVLVLRYWMKFQDPMW